MTSIVRFLSRFTGRKGLDTRNQPLAMTSIGYALLSRLLGERGERRGGEVFETPGNAESAARVSNQAGP